MKNKYDSFHQRQINIDKSVSNVEANRLMTENYTKLYSKLVHNENDIEVFNDAFIRISREYMAFDEMFCKIFNQLKNEYKRNDKQKLCEISTLKDVCITNKSFNDDRTVTTDTKKNDLINDLIQYANDQQTNQKRYEQQTPGATKNISVRKMEKAKKSLYDGAPYMRDLFE